jgi:hypothetical protein
VWSQVNKRPPWTDDNITFEVRCMLTQRTVDQCPAAGSGRNAPPSLMCTCMGARIAKSSDTCLAFGWPAMHTRRIMPAGRSMAQGSCGVGSNEALLFSAHVAISPLLPYVPRSPRWFLH